MNFKNFWKRTISFLPLSSFYFKISSNPTGDENLAIFECLGEKTWKFHKKAKPSNNFLLTRMKVHFNWGKFLKKRCNDQKGTLSEYRTSKIWNVVSGNFFRGFGDMICIKKCSRLSIAPNLDRLGHLQVKIFDIPR